MKRFQKMLVALVIAFMSFITLAACGEGEKILSAEIISGSMSTTVVKGGTVDTSNAKALIEYKDNYETVTAEELEFGTVDTSVVGNTKMKVKYGDYEFEVTIKVVATEADVNSISSLESQLLIDFRANKGEQENEKDEFYVKDEPLYVGDDNAFNFRLNAAGRDGANRVVLDIEKVRTNITVELKNGADYETLDATTLASYVTLDTENTTLDFTETAVGREFRVTVEAVNKDITAEANATKFTAELTVVDGYNVYNATDLSIYDNTNLEGVWTEKKAATGMTGKDTNAIILQDNINITKNDVPSAYFWNEATEGADAAYINRQNALGDDTSLDGTVKDRSETGIYRRTLTSGETFTFQGNYFKVDLSAFPKAVTNGTSGTPDEAVDAETGELMTSHFSTFYNIVEDPSTITATTGVNVNNVRFYGNGELNNNVENSGSIILMKTSNANLNAYNTLQHNFYIGYFIELGLLDTETNGEYTGTYTIDTCKGYNSYQCLIYAWGAENVIVKNSEFKNAGGPAIIGTHAKMVDKDPNTGNPTHVDIINSTVSSEVVGTEPWFTKYGATGVVQMLPLLEDLLSGNAGLPATDKTMFTSTSVVNGTTVKKLNLVGVLLSAEAEAISGDPIRGHIRVFDTQADYDAYYAANPTKTTYGLDMDNSQYITSDGSIYIESNGNGGYINNNAETNWDTSYFGFFQAQAVRGILADSAFATLTAGLAQMNISFSSDFASKTLAEQQAEIKAHINGIITLLNAGQIDEATALQALQGLYQYGFTANNAQMAKDIWTTITDNAVLTSATALATELCSQVDAFTNVSYADGSHLNLYIGQYGIGVVIGVAEKSTTSSAN